MAKPPVKAKQLADVLAEQIRAGEFGAGDWLPSERDLAAQHAVGRSTVRLALHMLAEEGLVEDLGAGGVRVLPGLTSAPGGGDEGGAGDGSTDARLQELEARVRVIEERLNRMSAAE